MFSYGLGDAGTGLVATQFGFFLFKFFISAGLPVIIAGSLLMLIKIWDAVNDPLIGWLSDRTKSRWGPRIPWMVAASVPLGFSLAAIWWTPTGSVLTKTIYYAIISIIVMTAYTSINLPFAALSTEISEKTAIRTRLNASRFTGSIIAGLTGLIIAGVVLGSEGSANNEYFLMGKISGCIAVAATLISCWGLAPFAKKARRPSGKVEAITLQFKRIFRNKKFLKVITLYILLWCALQLMQTVALIYVEDVLNVPTYIAKWIPIPFQISALVGLQIWTRVSNKLNRISALNYGAIMWIISCTAALFLPSLSKISRVSRMPLTYGGGIDSLEKATKLLSLGIEKLTGSVEVGKFADLIVIDENPLENLKVLYGTGAIKLDDENNVTRVGGVKYTIKDGIVYDAKKLLLEVKNMVDLAKKEAGYKIKQPGIE